MQLMGLSATAVFKAARVREAVKLFSSAWSPVFTCTRAIELEAKVQFEGGCECLTWHYINHFKFVNVIGVGSPWN